MGAVRKAITPGPALPRTDGIDVSKWQGAIDWPKVLGSGIWWVAMRVWDRSTKAPDQRFAANRANTTTARFRLLYHYLEVARPVTAQVTDYLKTIGQLAVGEGVMLDAEEPGVTVAMCVSWLQAVEAVTRIPSTVYTGGHVAGGAIWNSNVIFNGHRARFFAAYTSESEALVKHAQGKSWDAWQWTDKGKVAGVSTDVDCVQVQDGGARFAGVVRS
jgi:lysozyme